MRFSAAALLFFSAPLAVTAATNPTCNADNCLRAVVASAFTTRHGSADCSSFFSVTVTPATVTSTTTVSVSTVTATYSRPTEKRRDAAPMIEARQATKSPSSVPAYASACSGTARYSSACTCIGVTHATTTVAAPTTTTTVTVGSGGTVTQCGSPQPTFILQDISSAVVYNGIDLFGTYNNLDTGDGPLIGFNGLKDASQAEVLSLDPTGLLEIDSAGVFGFTNGPPGQANLITFQTLPFTYGIPVRCQLFGEFISCNNNGCDSLGRCETGAHILQICPNAAVTNDLWIGSVYETGCYPIDLRVLSVCQPPPT